MKKPPPEIEALQAALQAVKTGGRKTSVYLRTSALDKLEKAVKEWGLPASAIINIAVLRYLEEAGF